MVPLPRKFTFYGKNCLGNLKKFIDFPIENYNIFESLETSWIFSPCALPCGWWVGDGKPSPTLRRACGLGSLGLCLIVPVV